MSTDDKTTPTSTPFDALSAAGPRVFSSLLHINQNGFRSLVQFNLRQTENARLAFEAALADAQPLFKSDNPADFLRAALETAEKRSEEALTRYREALDGLREDYLKAVETAISEASGTPAPGETAEVPTPAPVPAEPTIVEAAKPVEAEAPAAADPPPAEQAPAKAAKAAKKAE